MGIGMPHLKAAYASYHHYRGDMRKFWSWMLRLLGPALLLIFLLNSNLNELYAILINADPAPILLSLVLIFPFLFIKAWRWRVLMHTMDMDMPQLTATGLYNVGIYLGSVTPGQAGDFIKAWYLRDRGYPLAPALLSVILDRLCDLLVMALLAIVGIFALGQLLPSRELQTAVTVLMLSGIAVLTVLLVMRRPREWVLTVVLPRILPTRMQESLHRWNEQMSGLHLTPRLIVLVMGASLISAMFTFYRLWLLFVSVDVLIPLYIVVGASALIAVAQVLPISIGGVGVRDAILIAVVTAPQYGSYSVEQALAVSALFLLITVQHILFGFILSFWFPIGRLSAQAATATDAPEAPAS